MSHQIRPLLLGATVLLSATACSTSGHFVVPQGSQLYLANRSEPVTIQQDGQVQTTAFGWGKLGLPPTRGIPYRLEKDGKVIQQGRLRSKIRVASFFVPPVYGIFAYPVGLNGDITYNLVTGEQK